MSCTSFIVVHKAVEHTLSMSLMIWRINSSCRKSSPFLKIVWQGKSGDQQKKSFILHTKQDIGLFKLNIKFIKFVHNNKVDVMVDEKICVSYFSPWN